MVLQHSFPFLDDNLGPILREAENAYLHVTSMGVIEKQTTVPPILEDAQTIVKLKSEPHDRVSKY